MTQFNIKTHKFPDLKHGGDYTLDEIVDELKKKTLTGFEPERENLVIDYRTRIGRIVLKRMKAEGLEF